MAHWVGDFALQGNTIADLKAKSIPWLFLHVALYTIALLAFSLFLFHWSDAVLFSGLNGAFHLVTDFITSRFANKYKSNLRIFYLIVGFDQLIHSVTLVFTLYLYSGVL